MAIWKLTIEDDEGQKTVVPLVRDEYSIGRRDGHAIRLTERNVSRDHAKIKKNGEGFVIEDLGSYNGVFVNGHRVAEPTPIHTGDLIIIGDYRIEAHDEQPGARVPAAAAAPAVALSAKPPSQPVVQRTQMAIRVEKPNRFVVLSGNDPGKEYPLDKPKMIVGRGDDVDIRVNHSSVSRHHAEIIALDEGRHEVIDQGSANGIRLNGQDVKRAIVSPGDLIELGDVQVKYVGAGQQFVFDAAAAEAVREIEARNERQRRKSGAWTWGIVVVLVGAAAAGGVMLARGSGGASPSSSSSKVTTPDHPPATNDPMAAALAKFAAGDPVAAYEAIKDDPKARTSPDFSKIVNGWAEKRIAQLKDQNDADAKKAGLEEIQSSQADEKYKSEAGQMLAVLTAPTTTETMTVAVIDAGKKPPPPPPPTATTVKPPPPATTTVKPPPPPPPTATTTAKPPTTSTAATPTPGNCPSYKGDFPAAAKNNDWECVRTMLLPRLNAGAISSGEARYLKAACTQLGDLSCAKRAAEKI